MQLTQNIMLVLLAVTSAVDMGPGAVHKNATSSVAAGFASTSSFGKVEVSSEAIHENGTHLGVSHHAVGGSHGKSIQFVARAKLDINQKVYIEGQPSLGDGAGQGSLNKCRSFAPQHVNNPDKPHVKVCGTGIKMTAYLRGACKPYYQHSKIIGKCQVSMPPDTCDIFSPAQDAAFGAYQSYKIEPC